MGNDQEGGVIDFDALMKHMALPETPADALSYNPAIAKIVAELDPIATVAILAGFQTEPAYQANAIRLDFAIRLVLALARGTKKPRRAALHRVLNAELEEARVLRLEDPIEDFFVEPVPTPGGDFMIFSGAWEQAGFYTETVLAAFSTLPDGDPKRDAIRAAVSLLRISNALVRRADLERRQIGGGTAKGVMKLPEEIKFRSFAKRVTFSWEELAQLGLRPSHLTPFALSPENMEHSLGLLPGNAELDFHPLVSGPEGIVVASPASITTAVRGILIDTAIKGGMRETFQRRLLEAQAEVVTDSGFVHLDGAPLSRAGDFLVRGFAREVSPGRFINYVQTMDSFDGWPTAAFGSTRSQPKLAAAIREEMQQAKQAFQRRGHFAEALTVCFLGGWGAGQQIEFHDGPDLDGWEVILLSPGDASAIARCEGGTVRDLWRLQKQKALVENQGFELFAINGLLNVFHWWRLTEHAFVPPGWTDVAPPTMVTIGTDHLLAARREGFEALDRRALPHPEGPSKIVTRLDPDSYFGGLAPIYGSLADVREGEFVGAVLSGSLTVWLHLDCRRDDDRARDKFETWKAALYWMELVLPAFLRCYGGKLTSRPTAITLSMEFPTANAGGTIRDDEISSTVQIDFGDGGDQRPRLELKPEWHYALRRPENVAEVELASNLLAILAHRLGAEFPISELRDFVIRAAGSTDLRWRHSFVVTHAVDLLKYHGLLKPMRAIPVSASALMKCGLAFLTHPREQGLKISGKASCRDFLFAQSDAMIAELCKRVACFNKQSFLTATLTAMQAALGELRSWEFTARATRAIHGAREDHRASLERANEANAVLRSASMLAEIANAEAQEDSGLPLGDMDLAELQALSLLIVLVADIIPTIMGDWMKPEIVLSPTGDVLTDHTFRLKTLQKSAERRHERERAKQSETYASRFGGPKEFSGLSPEFRAAIAAEYGADSEVVLDLAAATARLAANAGTGVLVLPRDELVAALEAFEAIGGQPVGALIDRLTMPVRNGWADIPSGYAASDFDLSRFDRRPSLIAKPIIRLSSGDNPRLLVAPAVIERTLLHNLGGAINGSLQNEFWSSKRMCVFSSTSGTRTGLEFNDAVAQRVKSLGLQAWPSAKPAWALNCKATPEIEGLGDVDVLSISADMTRVWVIEVKDLKLCRTMGEIARRLSEYRGRLDEKGRPDKMLRHLRRVAFIREHAAELVGRLKLPGTPKISGALVVRAPQPMEHVPVDSADARVVMYDDIGDIPWETGWSG